MHQRQRLLLLLAATLAWLWAISPRTPWAADFAPRLWLYDLLFYARVALLAWAAGELALAAFRRTHRSPVAIATLGVLAAAWSAAALYDDSGVGWRWRVRGSAAELESIATGGPSDHRRHAGHVIVDTVRAPCGARSPWLWLGRPHGAGSGTNLALVRNGSAVPDAPVRDAFVFLPLGAGWWMAYEHAATHHAASQAGACVPGRAIGSHRAGRAHVATGRAS